MDSAPGVERPAGGRLAAADDSDTAHDVLAGPVAAGGNVLGAVDRMEPSPVVDDVPAAITVESNAARDVLADPVARRRDSRCRAEPVHAAPVIEDVATGIGLGGAGHEHDPSHRILTGPVGAVADMRRAADGMKAPIEVDHVAPAAVAAEHDAARDVLADPVPSRCDGRRPAEG